MTSVSENSNVLNICESLIEIFILFWSLGPLFLYAYSLVIACWTLHEKNSRDNLGRFAFASDTQCRDRPPYSNLGMN